MKIRNGFVSNSSSSSFMIYGAYLDKEEIVDAVLPLFTQKDLEEMELEDMEHLKEYIEDDFNFTLEKKLGDLEIHGSYDGDGRYIGVTWSQIGGDETGNQFKARVRNAIEKIFGDVEVSTHSEVVYC
jgi:hypothetical protein